MNNTNNNRIEWLDYGKGICMLCVILFHTWAYYAKNGLAIIQWVEPFFLTLFFFISGYLTDIKSFNTKKSISSIIKRLIIPYLIFTSIIWVPKNLANGGLESIKISYYFIDILGGYASWFISALICSILVLTIILSIKKTLKWLWIATLFSIICGLVILEFVPYKMPWYFGEGLVCLFYISLGITYKKFETKLKSLPNYISLIFIILYIILLYINNYIFQFEYCIYKMRLGQVDLSKAFFYIIISSFAIYTIVDLIKKLPSNLKWLSYIGKNSLIFYFLNTGVLVVFNLILKKLGFNYNGDIISPIIVFIADTGIMYIASYIIMRFFPWMVGASYKRH